MIFSRRRATAACGTDGCPLIHIGSDVTAKGPAPEGSRDFAAVLAQTRVRQVFSVLASYSMN
jgi:hypothetical protein